MFPKQNVNNLIVARIYSFLLHCVIRQNERGARSLLIKQGVLRTQTLTSSKCMAPFPSLRPSCGHEFAISLPCNRPVPALADAEQPEDITLLFAFAPKHNPPR